MEKAIKAVLKKYNIVVTTILMGIWKTIIESKGNISWGKIKGEETIKVGRGHDTLQKNCVYIKREDEHEKKKEISSFLDHD